MVSVKARTSQIGDGCCGLVENGFTRDHKQTDEHLQAGYTLIELLVVLALMTLLIGLAPVMYQAAFPSARMQTIARDLASDLRRARHHAIYSHQVTSVTIGGQMRSYSSAQMPLSRQLPENTILTFQSIEGAVNETDTFYFFPDGSTTGGHFDIENDGLRARVTIHWLTGRIAVE